jgi:hypothetical protein
VQAPAGQQEGPPREHWQGPDRPRVLQAPDERRAPGRHTAHRGGAPHPVCVSRVLSAHVSAAAWSSELVFTWCQRQSRSGADMSWRTWAPPGVILQCACRLTGGMGAQTPVTCKGPAVDYKRSLAAAAPVFKQARSPALPEGRPGHCASHQGGRCESAVNSSLQKSLPMSHCSKPACHKCALCAAAGGERHWNVLAQA